jgi:hypothetical protein
MEAGDISNIELRRCAATGLQALDNPREQQEGCFRLRFSPQWKCQVSPGRNEEAAGG